MEAAQRGWGGLGVLGHLYVMNLSIMVDPVIDSLSRHLLRDYHGRAGCQPAMAPSVARPQPRAKFISQSVVPCCSERWGDRSDI